MVSAQVRLALQAMRYYRLWIYASNLVLMAGVVIFTSTAFALLSDPRRQLLPANAVSASQPSVIYAYAALFVQGGVLPVVGCIGALKLSERLLNSYWMLLLLLLAGDVVVGLVWAFRFQKMSAGLLIELKQRLSLDYGTGDFPDYDATWDLLQRSFKCCGVESPADFNNSAWLANLADRPAWQPSLILPNRDSGGTPRQQHQQNSPRPLVGDQRVSRLPLPDSCCKSASLTQEQLRQSGFRTAVLAEEPPGRREVYGTGKHRQQYRDYRERQQQLQQQQMIILQQQQQHQQHHTTLNGQHHDNQTSAVVSKYPRRQLTTPSTITTTTTTTTTSAITTPISPLRRHRQEEEEDEMDLEEECRGVWPAVSEPSDVHEAGCGEFVLHWLHRTGDSLFVLGYCILAFVKLCFLGILRYELREMVQKIKLLQAEQLAAACANAQSASAPGTASSALDEGLNVQLQRAIAPLPALVATDADTVSAPQSPVLGNGEVATCSRTVATSNTGRLGPRPIQRQTSFSQYSLVNPFHQPPDDLFSPPDTPVHKTVQQQQQHLLMQDVGVESDSGSHCALLLSPLPAHNSRRRLSKSDWTGLDPSSPMMSSRDLQGSHSANGWPSRHSNGNNNEYHELREIKQTQI